MTGDTTTTPRSSLAALFPLVARGFAALSFVFFAASFIAAVLNPDIGQTLTDLLRWGDHPTRAYELMISAIYIAWAPFLWVAAGRPAQHHLLLDFTLVVNAAHFGTMAGMSLLMHDEHHHLYGDVLLGWAGLLAYGVTWLAARPAAVRGRVHA